MFADAIDQRVPVKLKPNTCGAKTHHSTAMAETRPNMNGYDAGARKKLARRRKRYGAGLAQVVIGPGSADRFHDAHRTTDATGKDLERNGTDSERGKSREEREKMSDHELPNVPHLSAFASREIADGGNGCAGGNRARENPTSRNDSAGNRGLKPHRRSGLAE